MLARRLLALGVRTHLRSPTVLCTGQIKRHSAQDPEQMEWLSGKKIDGLPQEVPRSLSRSNQAHEGSLSAAQAAHQQR